VEEERRPRGAAFVAILGLLVATPATLAMGYYLVSGDPRVRPLAVTRESLAFIEGFTSGVQIVTTVAWGRDSQTQFDRETLKQTLVGAFYAHGEETIIEFEEVPGDRILITYTVGQNTYGPAEIDRAVAGVRAAVDAYRISINQP